MANSVKALQAVFFLLLLTGNVVKNVMKIMTLWLFSRRFTEHFVKKAHSVTCVDFLPSFLAVNRKAHGGCGNIKFIDGDVTTLDQPHHRFAHIA